MLSRAGLDDLLEQSLLRVDRFLLLEVIAAWEAFDPRGSVQEFTDTVLPVALSATIEAQEFAAEISGDHVADAVALAGGPVGPRVSPGAFSGIASDGRSLASLLVQPLLSARLAGSAGATREQMAAVGGESFRTITSTQVFDASRAAQTAAQVSNSYVIGHVRRVESGACDRCIILSGRVYRWSDGFKRHPRCKCTMSEVMRGESPDVQSPQEIFDGLSAAEQDARFGAGNARAVRDGADLSAVVNANRGMRTAGANTVIPGVKYTTEGTTRRGFYSYQRRAIDDARGVKTAETAERVGRRGTVANYTVRRIKAPRLMPEEIYRVAGDDRAEAQRLLIGNGYVVGNLRDQATRYAAMTPVPVPLG